MWGRVYWPLYLILVSVFFLVPETVAFLSNTVNTLSEYAWREMSIEFIAGHGMHTVSWWLSLVAWCVFVVLITGHIWWRTI
jgi:hypothetical protein